MRQQATILIILGLIIIVLLGGLGFFYTKSAGADNMVKILSSKSVTPVIMAGQIKNISGNNITLIYNGSVSVIKIKSGARISSIQYGIPQEEKFQDLKIGDNVNVNLVINSNYTIEGSQVLITPITN